MRLPTSTATFATFLRMPFAILVVLACIGVSNAVLAPLEAAADLQPAAGSSGWQIPLNARDEQNPLPVTPALLRKGKAQYEGHCQRCHGPRGKGDGPDGDAEHKPADLSDASRASRNADGVMFYKIWNGRKDPKMPAFKSELTKDDVWAIVAYAKTLRAAE